MNMDEYRNEHTVLFSFAGLCNIFVTVFCFFFLFFSKNQDSRDGVRQLLDVRDINSASEALCVFFNVVWGKKHKISACNLTLMLQERKLHLKEKNHLFPKANMGL